MLLDLANTFGSALHKLLWTAFNYFRVPEAIPAPVKTYFPDVQLCLTTAEYATAWQRLEASIMARCTISPAAFAMAMEVIIRASPWEARGEELKPGLQLPPITPYMRRMK